METELKEGEVVVNKADPAVRYVIAKIYPETEMAICVDAKGEKHSFPLIILKKYQPPGISDISNMW